MPEPVRAPLPDPFPPEKTARPADDWTPWSIRAVCSGDIDEVKHYCQGAFLELTEPVTGMSALHVAVGLNRLDMVKLIVEAGARFFPDNEGRMPSLIAAECETSEEMQDYIADEERKIETNQ